ncbi:transposase-like protein [Purpureocillium lilacinum]|uniref:Transposase-like protein n=1 Tax=Purpureocillium lilacinum TaxID=33203 RepID=A0A179F3R5_PURLI|nr:transposase-like protein [Purpureocillium lilacinum]
MIERALRKRTDIRAFIFALEGEQDEAKRIPADDILSNEDWRVLGEVNAILKPIYLQTMRTQGWGKADGHGRLWEVLKNTLPADYRAFIRTSINNGWKKLDEYHSKLGESPLFAAAIILHPRFGLEWLEATWVAEEQLAWVRDAKAGIKDYFSRWYSRERERREETGLDNSARRTMGQEDDQYTQWINSKTKKALEMGGNNGELDAYLRLEPQDTQDPIQWWREHTSSFPSLSSFALDVFAIPAMASDCERQFSLAKLTLTPQRLSMSANTLERVQCLKNCVRHGGVKLGDWPGS